MRAKTAVPTNNFCFMPIFLEVKLWIYHNEELFGSQYKEV